MTKISKLYQKETFVEGSKVVDKPSNKGYKLTFVYALLAIYRYTLEDHWNLWSLILESCQQLVIPTMIPLDSQSHQWKRSVQCAASPSPQDAYQRAHDAGLLLDPLLYAYFCVYNNFNCGFYCTCYHMHGNSFLHNDTILITFSNIYTYGHTLQKQQKLRASYMPVCTNFKVCEFHRFHGWELSWKLSLKKPQCLKN